MATKESHPALRVMGARGRIWVRVCSSSRGCRSCAAAQFGCVCAPWLVAAEFLWGGPCPFLVDFRWGGVGGGGGGRKEKGFRHSLMRVNAGCVSVWGRGDENETARHTAAGLTISVCALLVRVCVDGERVRTKLTCGKGGEIDLWKGAGKPRAAAAVGSS